MKPYCLALVSLTLLAGCNGPPQRSPQPVAKPAEPVAVKPLDESSRFPAKDQVHMELVDQHLLGRDFLPGGNIARYKKGNKTYEMFLIRAENPQKAALLMFDYKNSLKDAHFIAYMGGAFGMDAGRPAYVFAKGNFLAGIIGLPEKEADVIAREFAADL